MTNINLNIIKKLLIIDILLLLISIIFFEKAFIYSVQFGFISASLIMLASINAYRKMVDARVELEMITHDDNRDTLDKLEDPYDLYSSDIEENGKEKDLVEVVKEERARVKGNSRSMIQTIKDAKSALSIYRLSAYGVLILGFLYLNRHGLLDIISYIVALSLPMIIIVFTLLGEKKSYES